MENRPDGSDDRPDVFVSYSSHDRERVLAIVKSLRARGISLWVDQDRIDGGQAYTHEIPLAIGHCKGLVLFASAHAFDSDNVESEVLIAFEAQKRLLPVMLEPIDVPGRFKYMLRAAQRVQLSTNDADLWADAICRGLRHWDIGAAQPLSGAPEAVPPAPRSASHGSVKMALGELVPYLVNRIQQEREVRAAFQRHAEHTPRRPLVLVAHGSEDQAVHEYVARVQHFSLPHALQFVGFDDHVKWVELTFSSDDWQNQPAKTVAYLQQDVLAALGLGRKTWPAGVVDATRHLRAVIVLCYRLTLQRWTDLHLATLRAWIDSWSDVPDLPPRYPIVVFIAIKCSAERPTLLSRFGLHRREPLFRGLSSLARPDRSDLPVVVLTELGNVTFDHIEQWVVQDVRPPDPARMIADIKRAMNDSALLDGSGVPMERLIDRLTKIFEATARAQEIA